MGCGTSKQPLARPIRHASESSSSSSSNSSNKSEREFIMHDVTTNGTKVEDINNEGENNEPIEERCTNIESEEEKNMEEGEKSEKPLDLVEETEDVKDKQENVDINITEENKEESDDKVLVLTIDNEDENIDLCPGVEGSTHKISEKVDELNENNASEKLPGGEGDEEISDRPIEEDKITDGDLCPSVEDSTHKISEKVEELNENNASENQPGGEGDEEISDRPIEEDKITDGDLCPSVEDSTHKISEKVEELNENNASENQPGGEGDEEISDRPIEEDKIADDTSNVVEPLKSDCDEFDDGYDDNYTPFDDEDDGELEIDGYVQNSMGLMLKFIDSRPDQVEEEDEQRPAIEPGEKYTDKDFPLDIAIVQDTTGVEWKRPQDFLADPVLFHDEATRFDIGQGLAGTCWFLSTVATIVDKPGMINQVLPANDVYKVASSEGYDGVFHARFFRFGKWEDIFIDDYIPVLHEVQPWGARSSTNKNEIWISLLEKAFARMHGSYDAVYGGQPGDAYLQLTGGIGERIEFDESNGSQTILFERIGNALKTGSQITCVVPDEYDECQGLVGGHAYSLVGITVINNTKLVRVRNPWGRGEWKGSWSDESGEWEMIARSNEKVPQKDDGEFYIAFKDFVKYFSQITICSLTPDFDCDGKSDPMNFILNIFGQWKDGQMGGYEEVLNNPRFSFTVTEEGILDDGCVPLVIQMIQHTPKRKTGNASIRCDVYKIKGDKLKATGRIITAEIQGKKNHVYTTELQSCFRHKLKPGRYMVVPSTCYGDVQKSFLIRIYSPAPLKNIKDVKIDANILSCESEECLTHERQTYDLTFDKTMFGAFVSGINAGGQVSNRDSYATNPQYLISIPNTGSEIPLVVQIMQTRVEPQYPVGFRIFSLDKGVNPPVNVNYLYDKYNDSPADIEGDKAKFVISWCVDACYLLPPGRYVGLVHMDQPDTEKSFAIMFKSNTNIGIKGFQSGE